MVAIITVVAVAVIIIDYAEICPRNFNRDHTQTFQTICAGLCLFMAKFDSDLTFKPIFPSFRFPICKGIKQRANSSLLLCLGQAQNIKYSENSFCNCNKQFLLNAVFQESFVSRNAILF